MKYILLLLLLIPFVSAIQVNNSYVYFSGGSVSSDTANYNMTGGIGQVYIGNTSNIYWKQWGLYYIAEEVAEEVSEAEEVTDLGVGAKATYILEKLQKKTGIIYYLEQYSFFLLILAVLYTMYLNKQVTKVDEEQKVKKKTLNYILLLFLLATPLLYYKLYWWYLFVCMALYVLYVRRKIKIKHESNNPD